MSYNEDHLKKTLSNEKRLYARKGNILFIFYI